jgi:hypothetical protein
LRAFKSGSLHPEPQAPESRRRYTHMKFIDLNDDRVYTPADLKRDWAQLREEDPDNHAASFRIEFFEILMATINGRNDLEITGLTPRETSNLILRLRAQL